MNGHDTKKLIRHRTTTRWSRLRAFARGTSAGPLVEFAIIVPVLLLLVLGAVDLGRGFFMRNNLTSAVREGARLAAVLPNPCVESTIRDRVRARFSGVGSTAPANTSAAIPITYTYGGPGSGVCPGTSSRVTNITVTIATYPYAPITPFFKLLKRSGTINLSASATYRWERSP